MDRTFAVAAFAAARGTSESMHRILSSLLLLAALSSTAASGRASDASAAPPGAVSPISAVLADRDGDSMPDSKGGFARVRGTVTIPPDVVHDRNFQAYIQDDSGGISLFHWD
ncbi:MAG: hypothetical protein KY442_11555, partial [Proteobacteria bacterium]|nr:hypothetical protein [Pseudomonadota bacterium]